MLPICRQGACVQGPVQHNEVRPFLMLVALNMTQYAPFACVDDTLSSSSAGLYRQA